MSKEISLTLNGIKVKGHSGMTILELTRENKIEIPTLCYSDELSPIGACRVCVVEVEGAKNLVGSCHTPIQEGMVIETHSPKVLEVRRIIVELLLSSHSGNCLVCSGANTCELRKLAADLGVGISRFRSKKRFYDLEEDCAWMFRDMSKCIQCLRCIRACGELAKKRLLSLGYRGFTNKVVAGLDVVLTDEECKLCDYCVKVCPVGAIIKPEKRFHKGKEKPLIIHE